MLLSSKEAFIVVEVFIVVVVVKECGCCGIMCYTSAQQNSCYVFPGTEKKTSQTFLWMKAFLNRPGKQRHNSINRPHSHCENTRETKLKRE
jgi:hypothetical protein